MQDPHCLYSHVRIIENTDARVVVHWRYAPVSAHNHLWNVDPKTGFACWVDEYYTIYPDAAGVRNVTWQSGTLGEPAAIPGIAAVHAARPVFAATWCRRISAQWPTSRARAPRLSFVEKPEKDKSGLPADLTIQVYHFKAQNSPFIIFEQGNRMEDVRGSERAGTGAPRRLQPLAGGTAALRRAHQPGPRPARPTSWASRSPTRPSTPTTRASGGTASTA